MKTDHIRVHNQIFQIKNKALGVSWMRKFPKMNENRDLKTAPDGYCVSEPSLPGVAMKKKDVR